MELDSPRHHFQQYNNMFITIVVLVLDWLVLTLNQQRLLSYHSLYIVFLVLRLWACKQPKSYTIVEESTQKEEKLSNGQEQNQQKSRKCTVCNAVKPERYYHCKRCQKCIYLMDHHCHWIGNCIGQYNSKVYLHLLTNIFIHSTFVLGNIIYNYSALFDYQQYQIYYLIDFIPAVYSIYESQRLIHDFWLCVKNNQTLIQSFKKVHGPKGKTLDIWQKYMGKSRIKWLLPTFQSSENCNLLQKVIYPKDEQVKQYDDPEDYIYGPLDQQDQQLLKEK